jgi:serine/threonine protein kinase
MAVPKAQNEMDTVLGGRYRLEAPIGQGGTATVYRAHDEALGRTVAVKLYQAGISDAGRQEGELTVLASLDHHSLVNLIDAGVEHGADGRLRRYLVMALVNGSDLRSRLTEGRIAARHVGEIGYDMAEALHYIHSKNVIHRDLKPSNILLVDYGPDAPRARAKLTDFGIALAEDIERMTVEGATTGTAAYLSPEQAAGAPVGPPTDIYSLGLVLLECFTRSVEFPFPAHSRVGAIGQRLSVRVDSARLDRGRIRGVGSGSTRSRQPAQPRLRSGSTAISQRGISLSLLRFPPAKVRRGLYSLVAVRREGDHRG